MNHFCRFALGMGALALYIVATLIEPWASLIIPGAICALLIPYLVWLITE